MDVMDPEHIVDMLLFGLIGGLSWTIAAYGHPWFLLFGAPWMVLFVVSVWRVMR